MKLSKIYSNNEKFKPIIFNEGFNIIYADVENTFDKSSGKVQEHNLGKTSLVYLIDFLLLKGVTKNNFFGKHSERFSDWVFFLEIKLNNGAYLTVRRAVNPNTKISFKKHFSRNQDFINEETWDYFDLSINSQDKEKNPKFILEKEYLNFDVNPDFNYRNFLSYILRTQNDYQDVFKLNKFRGKDKDWKPALFGLLGFKPLDLQEKYELDLEIKSEESHIKKLQQKHESDKEIYKIKAAIEAKTIEKNNLKKEINDFDFYKKEKTINFDLVKNIENQISQLNKEKYLLSHNIEKIQQSLDSENISSVQVDEIKKMFKEIEIFFPDNLSKNYEDVLKFSKQITNERRKYLEEELLDLQSKSQEIDEELKKNNAIRGEYLSVLKEKDSFIKYKKYQEDLVKIEGEILVYQQKLKGAETIENYQKSVDEAKNKIKDLSNSVKEEIDKDNPDYQEIRRIFQEIYKTTFEHTALLVVEPNSYGNVDFETSVLNMSQNLTGKGDGYTSTKVLCASFVLAVLVHYSSKSFFRFAYHDGILESWGDNHKKHFISLVRKYCKSNDIQYVISIIKSDIPRNFTIEDKEIVRTLSNDDLLFGFGF